MRVKSLARTGGTNIILSSGRIVHYYGPFRNHPTAIEICEISSPPITADELDELADELKGIAGELRARQTAITILD